MKQSAICLFFGLLLSLASNAQDTISHKTSIKQKVEEEVERLREKRKIVLQEGKERLGMVDSALVVINENRKITTDTTFLARSNTKLILKGYTTFYGNILHIRSGNGSETLNDVFMSSDIKATVGVGVNYRGISAGFALNPAQILGKSTNMLTTINHYNNRFGIDLNYESVNSFNMRDDLLKFHQNEKLPNTTLKSFSANFYYVFNGKKFSYPAVFNSSWIQKKSAGSFLATASFYTGKMKLNDDFYILRNDNQVVEGVKMNHISLGFGYGYNLVVGKKWLFHLSAQPSIMMWKNYKLHEAEVYSISESTQVPADADIYGNNEYYVLHKWNKMPSNHFNVYIVSRAGITYSWSPRYFISVNGVLQLFKTGKDKEFSLVNSLWKARLSVGYRF